MRSLIQVMVLLMGALGAPDFVLAQTAQPAKIPVGSSWVNEDGSVLAITAPHPTAC